MTVSFRISITIFQAFPTTFSRVLPEFARIYQKNGGKIVKRTIFALYLYIPENYFFRIALNPGDGMIYGQDKFNSRNLWDEDFLSE